MAIHIDPTKIEATIADFVARETPNMTAEGLRGVIARAQVTLQPELLRFRSGEMNRDTHPDHVAHALVMMFASTMISEANSCYGPEAGEPHYSFINNVLQAFGEECGRLLSGEANVQSHWIAPDQAGRA